MEAVHSYGFAAKASKFGKLLPVVEGGAQAGKIIQGIFQREKGGGCYSPVLRGYTKYLTTHNFRDFIQTSSLLA